MERPREILPDIYVLPAHFPVPGAGYLPVNAYVIKGPEPILVDTGMGIDSDQFMEALGTVVDPEDLKWVWLTHDDADHTGSLRRIVEAAPGVRIAAFSLAVLRMSTGWPVPMNRVHWLNPGDAIEMGDRKMTAVRPPLFDNPTTIGAFDHKSRAFFCADSFGAIIPSPVESAADLSDEVLTAGVTGWASLDSPWAHHVLPATFGKLLNNVRHLDSTAMLSSHLPPALDRTEKLLEILAELPTTSPSIAPDQAALEQILTQMRQD